MNNPIVAHRNRPPINELAIPKTVPATFVAELITCCAFSCSFWISWSVESLIPSGRSQFESRSTRAGAFWTSWLNPEITAGTIRATKRTIAPNRIRKISPVAAPRFHPRVAR